MIDDPAGDEALRAIELNVGANYGRLRRFPWAEVVRAHDAHWHITGEPDHHWNGVTWANLDPDRTDERIDELLAPFRDRGVPIRWWVGPGSGPQDLGARLQGRGLEGVWIPGMAAPLGDDLAFETPAELRIERARDAADLEGFLHVLRGCYPQWEERLTSWRRVFTKIGFGNGEAVHHFVGRIDHDPVTAGFVCLGAGVAGLYAMHTVPEQRGLGYGRALAGRLMGFARARAYRVAVLHAAPLAVPLFERLGFIERCSVGLYHWPGSEAPNEPA